MTNRVLPPTRVLAVIAPVCAAGFGVACAAVLSFAVTPHKTTTLVGLAALLAASTLADRFPVPVEGIDTGGVSLSFVFGVASIVLFGWAAGLLVVCLAPAITQVLEQRPPLRVAYNVAVVALAATAAGAVSAPLNGEGASGVLARVGAAASAQHAPLGFLADEDEHPRHDRPLLADGLRGVDARRALGALAVPLGCARRAAARDRRRAARHAARAHRPADRPRQSPALPRTPRARATARSGEASPAHTLPRRRRRLQADQRPLRPPGRRPRPLSARLALAADGRGVPARRRRVRAAP